MSHRDINPKNIIYSHDKKNINGNINYTLQYIDFGLGKVLETGKIT